MKILLLSVVLTSLFWRCKNQAVGSALMYCGSGVSGFSGDGAVCSSSTQLSGAYGIAYVSTSSSIYVSMNSGANVRVVSTTTDVISNYIGLNGGQGDILGDISTTRMNSPSGLWYYYGYLYIADQVTHRVLRVDMASSTPTLFAGNGISTYTSDVVASVCSLYRPSGGTGYGSIVYIADTKNDALRQVNLGSLIISTITRAIGLINGIGVFRNFAYSSSPFAHVLFKVNIFQGQSTFFMGTYGVFGDQLVSPFRMKSLQGVVMDCARGDMYIADFGNSKIKKYNFQATTLTLAAGTGTTTYNGPSQTATSYNLNGVQSLAVVNNYLYAVENTACRIIRIGLAAPVLLDKRYLCNIVTRTKTFTFRKDSMSKSRTNSRQITKRSKSRSKTWTLSDSPERRTRKTKTKTRSMEKNKTTSKSRRTNTLTPFDKPTIEITAGVSDTGTNFSPERISPTNTKSHNSSMTLTISSEKTLSRSLSARITMSKSRRKTVSKKNLTDDKFVSRSPSLSWKERTRKTKSHSRSKIKRNKTNTSTETMTIFATLELIDQPVSIDGAALADPVSVRPSFSLLLRGDVWVPGKVQGLIYQIYRYSADAGAPRGIDDALPVIAKTSSVEISQDDPRVVTIRMGYDSKYSILESESFWFRSFGFATKRLREPLIPADQFVTIELPALPSEEIKLLVGGSAVFVSSMILVNSAAMTGVQGVALFGLSSCSQITLKGFGDQIRWVLSPLFKVFGSVIAGKDELNMALWNVISVLAVLAIHGVLMQYKMSSKPCDMQAAMSLVKFPSVSITIISLQVPGSVFCSLRIMSSDDAEGMDYVVGLLALVIQGAFLGGCGYYCKKIFPTTAKYQDYERKRMNVGKQIVVPSGAWMPLDEVNRYGSIFEDFSHSNHYFFFVVIGCSFVVAMLMGLNLTRGSDACTAVASLAGVVLSGTGVAFIVRMPCRSTCQSATKAATFLSMAILLFIAVAVSNPGIFVTMMTLFLFLVTFCDSLARCVVFIWEMTKEAYLIDPDKEAAKFGDQKKLILDFTLKEDREMTSQKENLAQKRHTMDEKLHNLQGDTKGSFFGGLGEALGEPLIRPTLPSFMQGGFGIAPSKPPMSKPGETDGSPPPSRPMLNLKIFDL